MGRLQGRGLMHAMPMEAGKSQQASLPPVRRASLPTFQVCLKSRYVHACLSGRWSAASPMPGPSLLTLVARSIGALPTKQEGEGVLQASLPPARRASLPTSQACPAFACSPHGDVPHLALCIGLLAWLPIADAQDASGEGVACTVSLLTSQACPCSAHDWRKAAV